jgi:nucleoporin SEH1
VARIAGLQGAMEGHSDAIMDCAYNFHGTRLATCAADRRIIVWDQSADGQWTHSCAPLERHTSAVYKVDWAHPEFGQVIASCSADRTVIVWEETQNRYSPAPSRAFFQNAQPESD